MTDIYPSFPQVLSQTSVSLDRLAPLFKCSWTGTLDLLGLKPLTYKKWADFSLLPAALQLSMKALMPSLMRAPSTAMHSSKTCPDERDRGFSSRPAQAGHQ